MGDDHTERLSVPQDGPTAPTYARCPCGHTWIALYVPMALTTMARILKGLHCPKCGAGPKKLDIYEPGYVPPEALEGKDG